MKIQWLGHSAFRLIESTGTSIVIDPFEPDALGMNMPAVKADVVTISCDHNEHNATKYVSGSFETISEQGAFEVGGVHISSVSSQDKQNRENLIFKFRLDGVEVCHLGRLGASYDESLVEQLMPTDILLVPCGGGDCLTDEEAKMFVDRLMPSIVIPMFYCSRGSDADLDKVDSFLKQFEDEDIEIVKTSTDTLEYERDDFDRFQYLVVVPKRFKG